MSLKIQLNQYNTGLSTGVAYAKPFKIVLVSGVEVWFNILELVQFKVFKVLT